MSAAPTDHRRGRLRLQLVAVLSTVTVLASGTAVYAQAHKSVTLDVNGVARTVSTFAGSVDGVLEEYGVTTGERDVVSPEGAVREGSDIVVRHARELTVAVDGAHSTEWTTALTADEALDTLATRGADVRLVASRSAERQVPELGIDLTLDGPADVQVDGTTVTAPVGSTTVAGVLEASGIELGDLDTVTVRPGQDGRVTVVVARVVVQDVTSLVEVAPGSVRQDDSTLPAGRTVRASAGVPGQRTVVERVTTVDGVESAREPVTDELTTAAVDEVVRVGTQAVVTAASGPAAAKAIARAQVADRGWNSAQFTCLDRLWQKESEWKVDAQNPSSSAYGIPQSLPGSKMASVASDWRTNAATQISWGLGYIADRYTTPCAAWAHSQSSNWY